MRAGLLVIVALVLAGDARADSGGTCEELHCYCDGPDHPDTVASCDTTCEDVCSSAGAGGGGPTAVRAIRLARWSISAVVGPSYTSRSAGGADDVPDGGSYGVELDGQFGRRAFGILWRLALASTPVESAAAGLPLERAWMLDWFSLGLEVSPRVAGGRAWELRPTAALWFTTTSMLGCDGCESAAAGGNFESSYSGNGVGARAGLDLYLGRRRQRGLSLGLVYSRLQVGDAGGVAFSSTPTEHQAPPLMVQLGLTSM